MQISFHILDTICTNFELQQPEKYQKIQKQQHETKHPLHLKSPLMWFINVRAPLTKKCFFPWYSPTHDKVLNGFAIFNFWLQKFQNIVFNFSMTLGPAKQQIDHLTTHLYQKPDPQCLRKKITLAGYRWHSGRFKRSEWAPFTSPEKGKDADWQITRSHWLGKYTSTCLWKQFKSGFNQQRTFIFSCWFCRNKEKGQEENQTGKKSQ